MHLAKDSGRWQGLVERGNEISGSIQCGKFLDYELLASQRSHCLTAFGWLVR